MTDQTLFATLQIPETLAAGPGPGNTDPRVLASFANAGLADHMHPAVLRGMIECKQMLRAVWGTQNIHTYGVGGTGFSGLDCMLNAVLPGDSVVVFVNGTFSGLDALTIRMKAATRGSMRLRPAAMPMATKANSPPGPSRMPVSIAVGHDRRNRRARPMNSTALMPIKPATEAKSQSGSRAISRASTSFC